MNRLCRETDIKKTRQQADWHELVTVKTQMLLEVFTPFLYGTFAPSVADETFTHSYALLFQSMPESDQSDANNYLWYRYNRLPCVKRHLLRKPVSTEED